MTAASPSLDEIVETFGLLDDWEDRYRYLIELGRSLPPLEDAQRGDANKVRGCASQVWLVTSVEDGASGPVLRFQGESDAHIVQGLIAVLVALYSGRSAQDILTTDTRDLFDRLGLSAHLTPQRSNGVSSMETRIKRDAEAALEDAA